MEKTDGLLIKNILSLSPRMPYFFAKKSFLFLPHDSYVGGFLLQICCRVCLEGEKFHVFIGVWQHENAMIFAHFYADVSQPVAPPVAAGETTSSFSGKNLHKHHSYYWVSASLKFTHFSKFL